jgi:hypothetical protein
VQTGFGNTKVLGYHPILATRADTGEVVHPGWAKAMPEPSESRDV